MCFDARGTRGRHRTQLAASPALLSPTQSGTHPAVAINVSKGGMRQCGLGVSPRGPELQVPKGRGACWLRSHFSGPLANISTHTYTHVDIQKCKVTSNSEATLSLLLISTCKKKKEEEQNPFQVVLILTL